MTNPTRLPALDLARGIALIGMVVFHTTFDLEMFGFLEQGTATSTGWKIFARSVAGAFVLLAGVSLVLAHGSGIRWRAFIRGTGVIALAAAGVSVATFLAFPRAFVFFGILHAIALFRLMGLPLRNAPVPVLIALGAVIWAAPYLVQFPAFDSRWLAWIGFSVHPPFSVDLEPIFPWFGPFLMGMAAARCGLAPRWQVTGALVWAGRNSLWIYLAHQPILLGALWLWVVGLS
ncbi:MAG: heparan-alpha-glucosaminide N-acetyltransferase [Paracoccaceae bacterium]